MGPVVTDNRVKFGAPHLNISRKFHLELFCLRRHFQRFCRDNFQPEVASDVILSANVGHVSVDATMKFGDSSSNGSRDIGQRSRRRRHFRLFFELR